MFLTHLGQEEVGRIFTNKEILQRNHFCLGEHLFHWARSKGSPNDGEVWIWRVKEGYVHRKNKGRD
jgi:hypothetical protein